VVIKRLRHAVVKRVNYDFSEAYHYDVDPFGHFFVKNGFIIKDIKHE
jgi:hypothetical protein